ncbi:hypothetical protein E2562_003378 [Oryza meyeriana var. granulata]|uniref:Uncharacterized protein n=1 Tax=Oryza meyeriana var. granulata TaxID=110450 RepID=A0A6G1EFG6_9ORYZ|nr:hypothetical protein E2562_003378 [Oryza meyeriana var. granulata]
MGAGLVVEFQLQREAYRSAIARNNGRDGGGVVVCLPHLDWPTTRWTGCPSASAGSGRRCRSRRTRSSPSRLAEARQELLLRMAATAVSQSRLCLAAGW